MHACSPIVNRRKKDGAEGKLAEAGAKKDDKKAAKKPAKKGKRGREPSNGHHRAGEGFTSPFPKCRAQFYHVLCLRQCLV